MTYNCATLIGRLGRDPEERKTQNGNSVVSFSMATSETWRDKATGERKEKTQWHNVVIWNEHIGKIAMQYLHKGDQCLIEGQIETREYTDKEGVERRTTEIVLQAFGGTLKLLGSKSDGQREYSGADRNDRPRETRGASTGFGSPSASPEEQARRRQELLDDDIPF